jgi:beta-glucanase (GH16 family)
MQRVLIILVCFGLCTVVSQGYWKQVWSDEFDGTSIDLNKWQFEVNCDGGGNNELQCYTNRATNAKVENGKLVLTAKPESYNGKGYTSARLNTAKSASWLYGRFEMNAKLPNGKHLWPAFWMLPTDNKYGTWAASGEIDIMEYRGQVLDKVEGTLHFGGQFPNNVYQGSGPKTMNTDLSAGFHTYAVEWDKDEIRWYVDTTMYHSMTLQRSFFSGKGVTPYTANRQPFDQRFFIVINLAIGGGFFPAGQYGTLSAADATAWKDSTYQIDYIRAYEWSATPAVSSAPAVSTPKTSASATRASSSATRAISATSDSDEPVIGTSAIDPNLENINGANQQQGSQSGQKGMSVPIVAGVFAGLGVLLIIAVVLAAVWYKRRASVKNMLSHTDLAVQGGVTTLSRTVDLPSYSPSPSGTRNVQISTTFVPLVGLSCQAKYSDGNFYPVTVDAVNGSQCLVNYGPSYGNEQGWVKTSDMKL